MEPKAGYFIKQLQDLLDFQKVNFMDIPEISTISLHICDLRSRKTIEKLFSIEGLLRLSASVYWACIFPVRKSRIHTEPVKKCPVRCAHAGYFYDTQYGTPFFWEVTHKKRGQETMHVYTMHGQELHHGPNLNFCAHTQPYHSNWK